MLQEVFGTITNAITHQAMEGVALYRADKSGGFEYHAAEDRNTISPILTNINGYYEALLDDDYPCLVALYVGFENEIGMVGEWTAQPQMLNFEMTPVATNNSSSPGNPRGGQHETPIAEQKVYGVVTNEQGVPIEGVQFFNISGKVNITAIDPDTVEATPVATSDASGQYQAKVTSGKSCLVAYAPGYDLLRQCLLIFQSTPKKLDFVLPLANAVDDPGGQDDPTNDLIPDTNLTNTASLGGGNLIWLMLLGVGLALVLKK